MPCAEECHKHSSHSNRCPGLASAQKLPNTSLHRILDDLPNTLQTSVRTRGAEKSLARPTSRFILFDGENIPFDASLVIYTDSNNIPPIMIINRIHEHQNLLSL